VLDALRDLRILLVEDNPGDAALVQEILSDAASGKLEIDWVETLPEAIRRLHERLYDVILLDLSLPGSVGLDTFLKLRPHTGDSPVIVLTGNEDKHLPLAAVRAGAEDYLLKDRISGESLLRAILFARERSTRKLLSASGKPREATRRAKLLAFAGPKGGVGTTTVAANVAWALSEAGHEVILAEVRGYYGTLADHFPGVAPRASTTTLWQMPPEKVNPTAVNPYLVRVTSHLRVLFGPQAAREARQLSQAGVQAVLDQLRSVAKYVICDLPPEPNEANQATLRAADFTGLVCDREAGTVQAAKVFLQHCRQWGVTGLIGLVLVNRAALSAPLDPGTVSRELGLGLLGTIPPAADQCVAARAAGRPLFQLYPASLVAESLLALAHAVVQEPIPLRRIA